MKKPILAAAAGAALLFFGAMGSKRGLSLPSGMPSLPAPGLAMSEGLIRQLDPSIQDKARQLIQAAADQGILVAVGSGLRSVAEQDALYAQGRTAAPGGKSWHNYGLAFDLAVLADGRLTWPNDTALWTRLGQVGESLGLTWGGRWSKPDWDHFQYTGGMTLAQAAAGQRPTAMA